LLQTFIMTLYFNRTVLTGIHITITDQTLLF
jgi:hypothetical protein